MTALDHNDSRTGLSFTAPATDTRRFDVTLAGETNLDLLLRGLPDDLPPERELVVQQMALALGGSAAITAHNLAALGLRVGFITSLADDLFAQSCRRELTSACVDLSRAVAADDSAPSGLTVLLQHTHFRRSFTYPGNSSNLRLCDLDLDYLKSARHFHLSSFFLQHQLIDDVPALFAELKEAGLTISLDTNDDPFDTWSGPIAESLKHVDLLMPNEREACRLAGTLDIDDAIETLARLVPVVVLKRGARGALLCTGTQRIEAPAVAVDFVDAIGAGDSFNAGFLSAFVRGAALEDCLAIGNRAGAYSTTQMGGTAAFRDRDALAAFLRQTPSWLRQPTNAAEGRSTEERRAYSPLR